jgi:hypothetical protein
MNPFVGAELRIVHIIEEPPTGCSYRIIMRPEPDGQWEDRWSSIFDQPQDHRGAVTRRSADGRPAATYGYS